MVGERWTVLVVRELMLGPRRFKDLLEGLPGIGTNLLAERLKQMEANHIVEKTTLPPPASVSAYALSAQGWALEPILLAYSRWGLTLLEAPAKKQRLSAAWAIWGMKAAFVPSAARGVHETYELRVGSEAFHARVNDGVMTASIGAAQKPDVVIRSDAATLLALASRKLSAKKALAQGSISLSGESVAVKHCIAVFALSGAP